MIPITISKSSWKKPGCKELYSVQAMDLVKEVIPFDMIPGLIGNRGHAYRGSWYSSKEYVSKNLLFTSLFSLDFDDGFEPQQFLEISENTKEGLPYFLYFTQSHTIKQNRFRAVWAIEINLNATANEYKRRIRQLAEPFIDHVDKRILSHYSIFQGSFNSLYYVNYKQLNNKIII